MNPNAKTDVSGDGDAYDEDRRFPTTVARSTPTKQFDSQQEDVRVDDTFDDSTVEQPGMSLVDSPLQQDTTSSVRDDADAVKMAVSGFGDEVATNPDAAGVPNDMPAERELLEAPEPQAALPAEPSVVPVQSSAAPQSKKKLYLIVGGVIALIVVGVIGYFVYANINSSSNEVVDTPTAVSAPAESKDKAKDAAVVTPDTALDDLTNGIASEATTANTDDTAAATDAAAAAATAGSGVDESNF